MVAQASNEVVEGFLEPSPMLVMHFNTSRSRVVHVGELVCSPAVVCLGNRTHVEGSWCGSVETSQQASLGA